MKCKCEFPEERIKIPQKTMGRIKDYDRWKDMVRRCYNPKHSKYHCYGGRGIKVCRQWMESFAQYLKDVGDRPGKMTIDREDNNGHYCPCNFRWATMKEQSNNKRFSGINNPNGKGVATHKEGFQVILRVDGKNVYIGFSKILEVAQKMYKDAYKFHFGEDP